MALDRRACLSLCFVSLILMLGSGVLLWSRWDKFSQVLPPMKKPAPPDAVVATLSAGTGWPSVPAGKAVPPASVARVPSTGVSPSPAPSGAVKSPVPGAVSAPLAQGSTGGGVKAPGDPAPEWERKIRFTLRDSRPSKVEITGSFNNWTPAPLVKGNNHVWEITVSLIPGEYTYNFLVDGKPVRDPNNPRTAPEGRSLLVVKPK